jgi:hypothetical protein
VASGWLGETSLGEDQSVLDRFSWMSTFQMQEQSALTRNGMIPSTYAPQQPSRRIVLLTKIKNTTKGLGSRTMAFFRKGDELEATGFQTLPYDDPMLVPPKSEFRNFDKIPRRRAPLVVTVLLVAVAAVGVFGWRSFRNSPDPTADIATTVRSKASGEWVRLKTLVGARQSTP